VVHCPLDLIWLLVALMWMILLVVAERSMVIAADDRQFVSEVVPRDVMQLQRERVVVASDDTVRIICPKAL
jgi:hypothetical protein